MQAHSVLPVDRLACPVPDCPFEATSQAGLRRHLLDESGDADVNAVLHAAVHARLGGDDTPAKADHDESSGTSTTTAEADAVPAEASPEWEGTDPPRDVVDGTDPLYGIARALGVEGRNDMEREHLVDAINERIDTAIRAPESAGSAEASPETSTFAGVVEPNSLARSEDDRTETYDVGPEREENRADTSDAAHSLVVALRELLEEIANVDTGRSPTETDAAVSEADRSPSETTPTGGTGAEPEPSEPDVADPGASADVSADEMAASDAIGNQVVPSGPSSEKSSSPEEIEALITDFEEERGGTTLLLSETHDESQRSFCDHALGVDEVNDRNVLLFRSRRLHTGELEHIAGSANTVRLLTLGYQPNVPSSVSDIVDATFVDHPDDLRRLGIIATRTIDEWHGEGAEIRVCFDSLSVMLRYVDEQQLFRFLHLLFSKLDNADAVTHCHLDPTSEESRVVGILRPLFDSVIELSGDPTDEEP